MLICSNAGWMTETEEKAEMKALKGCLHGALRDKLNEMKKMHSKEQHTPQNAADAVSKMSDTSDTAAAKLVTNSNKPSSSLSLSSSSSSSTSTSSTEKDGSSFSFSAISPSSSSASSGASSAVSFTAPLALGQLQKSLAEAVLERDSLRQEVQRLTEEAKQRQDMDKSSEKRTAGKDNEASEELQQIRAELKARESEVKQKEEKVCQLNAENAQLKKELQLKEAKLKSFIMIMKASGANIEENDIEATNKNEKGNEICDSENGTLKKDDDGSNEVIQKMSDDLKEKETTITSLTSQLKSLQDSYASLQKENEELKAIMTDLEV